MMYSVVDEEVLNDFLAHECDGFREIKVVSETPLILRFFTWNGEVFDVVVYDIRKVREVKP